MPDSRFTSRQRLRIYKAALRAFEKGYDSRFACIDIAYYASKFFPRKSGGLIFATKREYPEFFAQKPWHATIGSEWWPEGASEPRIKALKAAIELCQHQIDRERIIKQQKYIGIC